MTVIVAVTGSCGKTTTKDLIASVLGSRFQVSKSTGSTNCGSDMVDDLRRVRPDDTCFVQELGAWGPGTLDAGLALVRARVGVITNFRNDHYSAFHGPRGVQAEKGKLVAGLPADGTAVLNWDDPLVREVSGQTTANVFSFGRDSQAELRAADVSASWPEPLSFRALHGRQSVVVRTQLLGEHLLSSALAALSVGLVFGLSLAQAAAALEAAPPTDRRMTEVRHPDGVTFIRDDFKAPADSVPEVLAFMRHADAPRKMAVFGRISDYPGRSRRTYDAIARQAQECLDAVIFVGRRAADLWGERYDASPFVLQSVARASEFLTGYLRAGDLVLLKGSGPTDHLERVMLSRQQPVTCWMPACGLTTSCDACDRLYQPSAVTV